MSGWFFVKGILIDVDTYTIDGVTHVHNGNELTLQRAGFLAVNYNSQTNTIVGDNENLNDVINDANRDLFLVYYSMGTPYVYFKINL